MKSNLNNLHNILKSWGESQHQSPVTNEVLKAQILAKYSPMPQIPKWRWPWLSLSFAALAGVVFLVQSGLPGNEITSKNGYLSTDTGGLSAPKSIAPQENYYPPASTPISDSREFLKKDYNATIRTRKVSELTERIQVIIRGFSGRIDAASSFDQAGYINFVVPANRFEIFRLQIESLVAGKFYTEYNYVQNLLPQKQSIEQALAQAEKTFNQFQADRKQLVASHQTTVNSFQSRINNINKELAGLDPQNESYRQELTNQKNSLQAQLNKENKSHQNKLSSLDDQIKFAESNLENIKTQDQNLLDNVATVQGTISINRISIWGMIDLYLPGPLLAWLLLAGALVSYFWRRYREVYI